MPERPDAKQCQIHVLKDPWCIGADPGRSTRPERVVMQGLGAHRPFLSQEYPRCGHFRGEMPV